MGSQVLVLDVGTSSTKAVLFAPTGEMLAASSADHPIAELTDGRREQDAEHWWRSAARAARVLGPLDAVAAVSLAGIMQCVIPLDGEGRPVRPALLYGDARAAAEFEGARSDLAAANAWEIVGNEPDASLPLCKILWLGVHEPSALARTAMILSGAKDYVAHRLTGGYATDAVQSTTTGMMDLARRQWSPELVALAGIGLERLPPILPCDAIVGRVQAAAAAALGLRRGIPVINGSGDAGATTMAGEAAGGEAHGYIGTTGWIARSRPLPEPLGRAPFYRLAHPQAGRIIEVAPTLNAADALAWFETAFPDPRPLDEQIQELCDAVPDAGTPLFLPYLSGERSPFVDFQVRAAFLGLDRRHRRRDCLLAVLEGVAFALRHNFESLGCDAARLPLAGGGAKSAIWCQLIADAIGRPVEVGPDPAFATALGAFLLAAAALGLSRPSIPIRPHPPRPQARSIMEQRYRKYLHGSQLVRQHRS